MNISNLINNLLMVIDLKDISSNSHPPPSTNNMYITYVTYITYITYIAYTSS